MNLAGYIKLTFGEVRAVKGDCSPYQVAESRTIKRKISRFRGVAWDHDAGKWKAEIRNNGRTIVLGHYNSEEVAAWLYDAAALRLHGPSDKLNFPSVSDR